MGKISQGHVEEIVEIGVEKWENDREKMISESMVHLRR